MLLESEILKLKYQLSVINMLVRAIDDIFNTIIKHHITNVDIDKTLDSVFDSCKHIIEVMEKMKISDNSTLLIRLEKTIKLIKEYWKNGEINLFLANWIFFIEEWQCFLLEMQEKLSKIHIIYLPLN